MNVHVNRPGKYIKCRLCLVGLKWGLRFCISMPIKVRIVKAMVFFQKSCMDAESWTIKKAEHQRIDAFKLWCWGRLLRVPWTARRSNHSIREEINPECSLEALMLKLQYFVHLMQRVDSLEKTLMLGKIEGRRRREYQRMRWLDSITSQTKLNDWTAATITMH